MRKRESADSCTTILVGKNASYDGSTIVARTEDSQNGVFTPKKLIVSNRKINRVITSLFYQLLKSNYQIIQFAIQRFQMRFLKTGSGEKLGSMFTM